MGKKEAGRIFVIILLLFNPAFAKKPKTTFDKNVDFSQYKTYAWVKGTAAPDASMDVLITFSVDQQLQGYGLRTAEPASADLLVRYDAAGGVESSSAANDPTYAASGGIAPITPSAIWTTGGTIDTLTRGSLSIQLLDQAKQRVVWTSTVQEGLDDRPMRRMKQVHEIVGKMFKGFPRKR